MNVGDKVRMLRGKEEGIVTRIIDTKLIEIEIEDGFQIPVLRSELVVVAREEASYFKRTESEAQAQAKMPLPPRKGAAAQEGYFVSFKPLNDRLLSIHLINNSEDIILYSILEEKGGSYNSLLSGHLKARQAHKFTQADMHDFDQWPIWHVRVLPHPNQPVNELPAPLHLRLHAKAPAFFKSMRETPVLNTKSYLFPLSSAGKLAPETVTSLQDRLQNNHKEEQTTSPILPGRIPAEVDLHLEKLLDNPKEISPSEILQLQLETFEKALDRAMAAGMDEITFIHGVGNGTLRKEIHRRLGSLNTIAWFKDAQKEKWGYGATQVRLK